MQPSTRRLGAFLVLLALLVITALSGCSSNTNGTNQKATATTGPRATTTTQPGGTPTANGTPTPSGTPSPTPTPLTACTSKLNDVVIPDNAVQVGSTGTVGATISCMYHVPQDLQTLDTFFKTQMGKSGWTLLHDTPEGVQGVVQQYFKALRFATITLTQSGSDAHSTDVTISVESSQ
jgi:hypothetical protein